MYSSTHMLTVICKYRQMLMHNISKSSLKVDKCMKMELFYKPGALALMCWIAAWQRVKDRRKLLNALRKHTNME